MELTYRGRCKRIAAAIALAWGFAATVVRAEDVVMPAVPPPPASPALAPTPEAAPASVAASPPASSATPTSPAASAAPVPVVEEAIHPFPTDETSSRWYGWQTLATDGAAVALVLASIATAGGSGDSASGACGVGAVGVYALGAPAVHFVHGNPGRGFASLGIRVGAPVVLGFLGVEAENCGEHGGDFCGFGGALLGVSAGIIGAIAIDAAVLAYDDEPADSAYTSSFLLGIGPRGVVASGTF